MISRETSECRDWVVGHADCQTGREIMDERLPPTSTLLFTNEGSNSTHVHPQHKTVCHGRYEWAHDDDGDGIREIYRKGFETVLFLQALVLESSTATVLGGVAVGLGATLLVGLLVFAVQTKLLHKKMLIVSGIFIGVVLLQMVGKTVNVMQVIGWIPLHPIRWLSFPYWAGMWFGLYATWTGILLQVAAGTFAIGSYFLAEHRKPCPSAPSRTAVQPRKVQTS